MRTMRYLIDLLGGRATHVGIEEAADDRRKRGGQGRVQRVGAANCAGGFYMHVTATSRVPSILKSGLVPNFGGGNYGDTQWVSLDGVYASRQPAQLVSYLRAHGIEQFSAVVIEVAPDAALPDEDTVVAVLRDAYDREARQQGIDLEDGDDDAFVEFDDPFWGNVATAFHAMAGGKGRPPAFVAELVEYWADFEFYHGGDTGPDAWAALKDQAARFYRNVAHPNYGTGHSIRIPARVGFEGPTRIVAIVDFAGAGAPKLRFGTMTPAIKAMVDGLHSEA